MKQLPVWETIGSSNELAAAAPAAEYGSNVMVLYQDVPALAWARAVCERVNKLVGPEALHSTSWKINDLSSPGVLAGAVSTAMRADVIVVSVHAAEALPLAFYVWVDSWLPHRRQGVGTLLALLGLPEKPSAQLDRVRDYLRVVARQGGLDFLSEERKLAPEPAGTTKKENRKRRTSLRTAKKPGRDAFHRPSNYSCSRPLTLDSRPSTSVAASPRYALAGCSSDR